jgi:hypothetical protein
MDNQKENLLLIFDFGLLMDFKLKQMVISSKRVLNTQIKDKYLKKLVKRF